MFTKKILEALNRVKINAEIKKLRKDEGLPEIQEAHQEKSHPVFTEEVFRILLKQKISSLKEKVEEQK